MDYDFNFNINVSIWGDNYDGSMKLIPGNLSQELKDLLKKEISYKVKDFINDWGNENE